MKTTVTKLRHLIREYIEIPREELVKMINDMSPDEAATEDYVDSGTGEVLLGKGEFPPQSYEHEKYVVPKGSMFYKDEDDDFYDPAGAQDKLIDAIKKFAANIGNDLPEDASASDVAPDIAENFFYEYPKWEEWAAWCDMNKQEVKEIVVDYVYEALTK